MLATSTLKNEYLKVAKGKARIYLHRGQTRAWDSERRVVFIIAGTQSGKTVFGPPWLYREIQRKGPGDYLAATATYDLFKLKMLPEMRRFFCEYLPGWRWLGGDRIIISQDGKTRIILRSANVPEGLESTTAKGAWLDECGQDTFKLDSWQAVNRRLALEQGRILGTTTVYNMGWLKSEIYDRWVAGEPEIDVIQFESTMNPAFPKEEFERAKSILPPWKFNMFYRGLFTRPAGMIYDSFDDVRHRLHPFEIPAIWPRYGGLDFGGVHTAAICYAEDPESKTLYAIREYMQGGKTAREHADTLRTWGCRLWVGGAKSEGQWRQEFAAVGLPIREPVVNDVEIGINRVYGAHKRNEIYVFDTLSRYMDEKGRYSRKLDSLGHPTEEIENKNDYHMMDAERYIIGYLRGGEYHDILR